MTGMHRPLFIAAFVLLLVCVPLSAPLSAQHGGGHGSGGGHSFGGGHGGFGGGHAFSGGHAGSGFAARPAARGFASRPAISSRGFNRGVNRSGVGVRIRSNGLRNRYGYGGYGYPWLYGGLYDPYWWWDSGSAFDYDKQYETGLANEMNEQSLEEQRLRQQGDQDVYAKSAPAPPRAKERSDILPATVLVFHDQHKLEVQNYAIVGQTLWNFAPEHTQKIPLSDLDLPATTKANDERGVDFRLPGAREGQ
jgi:hypothetical protein